MNLYISFYAQPSAFATYRKGTNMDITTNFEKHSIATGSEKCFALNELGE